MPKGGRNQELALAAAEGISGLKDTAIFSIGSDGTDGPTDAAGGYCDGETKERLRAKGIHSVPRNLPYCRVIHISGLRDQCYSKNRKSSKIKHRMQM